MGRWRSTFVAEDRLLQINMAVRLLVSVGLRRFGKRSVGIMEGPAFIASHDV